MYQSRTALGVSRPTSVPPSAGRMWRSRRRVYFPRVDGRRSAAAHCPLCRVSGQWNASAIWVDPAALTQRDLLGGQPCAAIRFRAEGFRVSAPVRSPKSSSPFPGREPVNATLSCQSSLARPVRSIGHHPLGPPNRQIRNIYCAFRSATRPSNFASRGRRLIAYCGNTVVRLEEAPDFPGHAVRILVRQDSLRRDGSEQPRNFLFDFLYPRRFWLGDDAVPIVHTILCNLMAKELKSLREFCNR